MSSSGMLGMQFKSYIMQSTGDENYDPNLIDTAQYASTKFYFQQRRGRLDLRTLSQIDLERIVRDVDIDVLQMHLENITFCNLKEEDLRFLTDPQVIKLFRTSQLMIEYLLYAQEQLASNLQQMANRYGSKKRSLARKRIELAELQESTKHLREEVKTKKNSVSALEHLLKTTNRSRPRRRSTREKEEVIEEKPIRQSVIQFFVSGPEGLCVEFSERPSCSIFQLVKEVRKAFASKQDKRRRHGDDNIAVRLVYHGRILLEEGNIESNNIRPGDTIVAIIEKNDSDNSEPETPKMILPAVVQSSVTPEVIDLLAKQQESMRNVAQEMRLGWESALQTLSANQLRQNQQQDHPVSKGNNNADQDLLGEMDERYKKLEQSMRDQLNSQLGEYKELLAAGANSKSNRSGLQVGDLESDTEDLLVTRDEFAGRLRDSSERIGRMDGEIDTLKGTVNRQNIEMEMMRKHLLDSKGVHNTYITHGNRQTTSNFLSSDSQDNQPAPTHTVSASAPALTPALQPVIEPAPKAALVPDKKPKVIFAQMEAPSAPPRPVTAAAAAAAAPVPITKPAVVEKEELPVVKEELDDGCVEIIFPFIHNPDLIPDTPKGPVESSLTLQKLIQENDEKDRSVSVRLLKDISVEDLVFELRHFLANKSSVPLNRVALVLDGKVVTMGLDVEHEKEALTAVRAASLSSTGALTTRISRGKPPNDAQLDILVSHWEGQQLLGLAPVPASHRPQGPGLGGQSPTRPSRNPTLTAGIASGDKKRRSWDENSALVDKKSDKDGRNDPHQGEDAWGTDQEMSLRKSLSATLQGLSDREGLTDDELESKLRILRQSTDDVPEELYTYLKEYRGSVAGAMAAAAADSGSEDLYADVDRNGRVRSSIVSLALSEKAQTNRQNQRSSKDFSLRDSNESTSTAGLLRLSLLNGGWGRRSIESFDDDEGDYSYGHKSGSRGYDEDSAPMMASLTLQKGKHTVDSSLTSAVDMRASQSILSPDLDEASRIGDVKRSKYKEFVDSIDASNTVKRIPFGDDDDDVIEELESGGAKSLREKGKVAEEKSNTRSEGKDSKNSPTRDYSDVHGFQEYDSDEEGDGSLTFDLSQGNIGSLSGFQQSGHGRMKESIDLGVTGKTVSTLGGSGSFIMPVRGDVTGKRDGRERGERAEERTGMGRFDFDRTVDSEGEMLKGRDAPMSQVMLRADALEKQYSSKDAKNTHTTQNTQRDTQLKTPQHLSGRPNASPMSRGSSVNSGLFDNLGGDDVHDFTERDHDGTNSLALSNSDGGYDDSVLLPSVGSSR